MDNTLSIVDFLQDAIDNGEVIKVIYHGGSTPGQVRELSPRQIEGDKLKAHCITSGSKGIKTFSIPKIEPINTKCTITQIAEVKKEPPKANYDSLEHFLNEKYEYLTQLGWQVFGHADDFEDEVSGITLHESFKSGKPKKSYSVCLLTTDGESKPYYVKGLTLSAARAFSKLDSAISLFLEQAVSSLPKNINK